MRARRVVAKRGDVMMEQNEALHREVSTWEVKHSVTSE